MNSELNLELYTIAMTRLNNGFAKIGDALQDNVDTLNEENISQKDYDKIAIKIVRALPDFSTANDEFEEFLDEIKKDLAEDEINMNEYEPFFKHVNEIFPAYESQLNEGLDGIKEAVGEGSDKLNDAIANLEGIINQLAIIFKEILKIADEFFEKINSGEIR